MTQKHVQVFAYAVLLILGVSTAWAEGKKEGSRELLPAPKCCCDKAESCTSPCCTGTEGKETAIERRLRVICSIDFKETPLLDVVERFREWAGVNIVVDEPALADMGVSLQRA